MKNIDLEERYNKIYKNDSQCFYSFSSFPESLLLHSMIPSWTGLRVLEVGCGEGRLAAMIGFAGAEMVDAIDYSREAVEIAKSRVNLDNVQFSCTDVHDVSKRYDVIVLQGVMEHLDDPFAELEMLMKNNLNENGCILTSSPSFINPRGYVWMTLQLLFDVPMSLTDIHFLCPFDFEKFAEEKGCNLEIRSTDQDWGAGTRTLADFRKRLVNALRDVNMNNLHVERLLAWLEKAIPYHHTDEYSGATVAYRISPRT